MKGLELPVDRQDDTAVDEADELVLEIAAVLVDNNGEVVYVDEMVLGKRLLDVIAGAEELVLDLLDVELELEVTVLDFELEVDDFVELEELGEVLADDELVDVFDVVEEKAVESKSSRTAMKMLKRMSWTSLCGWMCWKQSSETRMMPRN